MTTSLLGGGLGYQSVEARALGSIKTESYDYKDQTKFMTKIAGDVSYLAAYTRKMQKGIDDASNNFIQQAQSLLGDFLTLLGGGGDTGFQFGDLKYVLQAIGAMFGFNVGGDGIAGLLPINLFQAAWHFFSNYILPVDNFNQVIDLIIDGAIASVLDIFGDVPILGQALQQLAVILSNLRDAFGPLLDALDKIFGVFSGDWLSGDFGAFDPLWEAATTFFGVITGPILTALLPIFEVISQWSMPFIEGLTEIVTVASNIIAALTGSLDFNDFGSNFDIFGVITRIVQNFISNGLLGPNSFLNAFNIFGILDPSNLGMISITNLFNPSGGVGPNLLVEPNFDSADSIALGSGWIRDATTGKTSNGAAKATVSAVLRELESIAVPVTEAETMNVSAWLKWSALGYTGTNPVTLNVNRYNGSAYIGTTQVATQASPATNQAAWVQFSGTYTVPAGCTHVKLTFRVNTNASSGFVWFDDAILAKTSNGLPQGWISGLLDSLGGLGDFIQGLLDTLIGIIRGIPLVGGTLADLLEQFTGQTKVIADNSAVNNQILAAFGPGNPDADDFERSTVGAKWTTYQTGTGTFGISNGHDIQFVSPYSNTAEYLSISDTKALTDNMQGAVVLATAPDTAFPLFSSPVYAFDDIWLRVPDTTVSWATRTGLRCRISSEKKVTLSWFLNGVETVLLTPTTFDVPPTVGASWAYDVGVGGIPRRHVAKIGATPIMDFTEAGTVSQIGGKRRAFGGKNVGSNTQANSSAYKQWTAQG